MKNDVCDNMPKNCFQFSQRLPHKAEQPVSRQKGYTVIDEATVQKKIVYIFIEKLARPNSVKLAGVIGVEDTLKIPLTSYRRRCPKVRKT